MFIHYCNNNNNNNNKYNNLLLLSLFIFLTDVALGARQKNESLICYQCVRHADIQCDPDELLPCPKSKDRCVTHIQKDEENPLTIKRECGLGPCDFGDEIMNRGLGLDICDRSKDKFFCIFCCTESGCNNSDHLHFHRHYFLIILLLIVIFVCF
ncbi:uncharacterized protein LOC142322929 [Lycorma delicatula]|uniref:uncharacterized protein LOC142322929 n=1 Tax=Lycorma delicatula TaxID=130591 RepID=UPI003F51226B